MAIPDSVQLGTHGNDFLTGTDPGNDSIVGNDGNDNLSGLGGADTLDGGHGNDFLGGGAGDDLLLGGPGSDTLLPGAGSDTVDGGAILDRTNYTDGNTVSFVDAASAVTLDLAAGTAIIGAETDQLSNVNFVLGSDLGDSLKGSAEFDLFEQFEGRAGDDTIDGGAIDALGSGSNRVNYNSAPAGVNVDLTAGTADDGYGTHDTLLNINQVRGSNFADTLTGSDTTAWTESFEGRGGNDTIDGKGGIDQVRYDSATTGVNVNLATGQATDGLGGTDTLLHIEGVRGSNSSDTLVGSDTSAFAGTAADFEFFTGQGGNDSIDGGGGFDRADYNTALFGAFVDLAAGMAQDGQGGQDTLVGIEAVRGGDFNDVIFGSDAAFESFEGRGGNDFFDGRGGIDRIDYQGDYGAVSVDMRFGLANDGFGGSDSFNAGSIEQVRGSRFADTLIGGFANETLEGGGGNDTLSGTNGNDTFVYQANGGQGVDLITDFNAGDVIEVRTALTAGASTAGDGSTVAGKGLQVSAQAGVTTLAFDLDGVAGAELRIQLAGVYDPAAFTIANSGTGPSFVTYTGAITPTRVSGFPSLGNLGDTINGTAGADSLVGGRADDVINAGDGNDTVQGGDGNDTLNGLAGDDQLFGGAGSDTLAGGVGNDTLDGGEITDRLNYTDLNFVGFAASTAPVGVHIDLQAGTATLGTEHDTLVNINFVQGSNQNDTLTGSNTFNLFEQFEGLAGNDTIDGGAIEVFGTNGNRVSYASAPGAVTVDLALGQATNDGYGTQDTLVNINFVRGSNQDDTLLGSDRTDQTELFDGRGGNDFIDGRGGIDIARYDGGPNGVGVTVNLATGTATDAFGGTDTLSGIEGVRGSNAGDVLTGGNAANDAIEIFQGNGGNDTIDGGSGFDRADYSTATFGVNVDLSQGTAQDGQGGFDTLSNIEGVRGSEFSDVLIGSDNPGLESFEGRAGDDFIDGRGGIDRVDYQNEWNGVQVDLQSNSARDGQGGHDTLVDIENVRGSSFDDDIAGDDNNNVLQGNAGNDLLNGLNGDDTLDGGAGIDTVTYEDAFGGVFVNLQDGFAGGAAGNDSLVSIENVRGTAFDDNMTGSAAANLLQGGAGNDFLDGGAGDDVIDGGAGNGDAVGFDSATAGVTINLQAGTATGASSGNDTLLGIENAIGSRFDDAIQLSNNGGFANGRAGNDAITGGTGNDNMVGGSGNDTLTGVGPNDGIAYFDDGFDGAGPALAGVRVDLGAGTATDNWGDTDTLVNIQNVTGSALDDTLIGSAANNFFDGAEGNDSIDGGAGFDSIGFNNASGGVTVDLLAGTATGGGIGTDTLAGIESVNGTNFADTVQLGAGNGNVNGRGGDDTLVGGGFDDFMTGGSGNDSITGGAGFDTIDYSNPQFDNAGVPLSGRGVTVNLATGTATDNWGHTDTFSGIELVRGSSFGDVLTGGNPANGSGASDGFEGFTGMAGNDTIDGGAGFDRAQYDTSVAAVNVTLGGTGTGSAQDGFGGVDTLISIEEVRGSSFNDTLTGSDSGVFESFEGRGGNDTIDGKGGVDRVSFQTSGSGVNVDLAAGTARDGFGGTDTLRNIENIRGSEFNDTLAGDAGANDLDARGGDDVLLGGAGQDTLRGGTGNDTLDGGSQVVLFGWDATANASGEVDIASYQDATSGVTIRLGEDGTAGTATGGGGNDVLRDIELVIGSNFGDEIHGSNRALNELVRGGAGDDTLFGGAETGTDAGKNFVDYRFAAGSVNVNLATGSATGADGNDQLSGFHGVFGSASDDTLTGDAQDNFLEGGQGDDALEGGAGARDLASYQNASGAVNVNLALGTASGADGNDALAGIEDVRGGEFADTLTGDGADNQIQGRAGNDAIDGGAGNDALHGGFGDDTLTGGSGRDTFQFGAAGEGTDTITDFTTGDVLHVGAALATTAVTTGSGTGLAGFGVQAQTVGGVTTLSIDTDGVAGADLQIRLLGSYAAADFSVTTANGASDISLSGPVRGVPVIQGAATEDQTLTVSTAGLADPDGLGAFSYQWLRDGVAVDGATLASYTLGDADVGKAMTVRVSYVDGNGHPEAALSAPTAVVANVNDAPQGTLAISGSALQGQTLTAVSTVTDADGMGALAYQWFADGTAIDGATASSLVLGQAQVGRTITVTASYQDAFGTRESVSSGATPTVQDINDAPTGALAITGTPVEDGTLGVSSTLADADGLGTLGYQWFANGAAIGGATGDTLVLTQEQVGKTITVTASYQDQQGHAEAVTSAATAPVQNVNDPAQGGVTIGGTATQGATLTAAATLADEDGLGTIGYQWFANGTAIAGATADSLVLAQAQVGATITVRASYVDAQGTAEGVTSTATAAVANVNDTPTGAFSIGGFTTANPSKGQTLSVVSTVQDADGLGPVTFTWLRDGTQVGTGATYQLADTDVGGHITVRGDYVDGQGTAESLASVATGPVQPNSAPQGTVTVSGTYTQGQTLSAAHNLSDADGLGTITFQWTVDGTAIAGATGNTFVLTEAQVGRTVGVVASYVDQGGSPESVSSPAQVVANANDPLTGTISIGNTAPKQGDTLAATHAFADVDGLGTVNYQWFADGAPIAGATASTFTLGQAQVGKTIIVQGSYVDGHGTFESRSSAATAAVTNVNDPVTGRPVLSNATPAQGQTLTVDTRALADADGLGAFSFQWLAGGAVIAGATGTSFTLTQAQVGQQVTVNVSYTDALGSRESIDAIATAPVANVNDAPTGATKVDGARVVGMPLQANTSAVADIDGLPAAATFSFQWLRDGTPIDGATARAYTPTAADGGANVAVQVGYTDLFGQAESLTSGAVPVVNEDLVPVLVVDGVASVAGDGNGDGIKDSLQEAVVSAPLVVQNADGTAAPVFVTLVADASTSGSVNEGSTAAIQTLNQEAAPEARPTTLDAPLGLIDFTAATTVGKTETFTLFVDASLGVNGYWKQDDGGTWVNLASRPFGGATTQVGNKIRLDFQITDGGEFDNDGLADGIITDPAIIGAMPLSIVGYAPDVSLTPDTHFFF